MNSLDILHTVNVVAVATSNLRFCYTFSELTEAWQVVWAHLQAIRSSISHELYCTLFDALDKAYQEQLSKIEEFE